MTGQQLGQYQILEKLGEGGMGVVYKARDSHLDRLVVLKILPKGFIADEERRKRFRQEAKTASALNHPNIVTIYDIDRVDGVDFIAMEYIEGKTLDALIGKTGLRLSQALAYAVQIADAAAAAHGTRIIHRDLKPSNVMVTESGVVKVLDFGLAKQIEPAPTGPGEATRTEAAPLTEAGAIMGTPAYMSPEQAEGKNLDARSDIFSFGTILYEMLTGQRPFSGETNVSTMAAILREEPKPVTSLSVALPREVDRIVSRCLRKAPPRRFQTMGDLKVALAEVREEAESGKLSASAPAMLLAVHPRRWPWVALAACGFAAAAVATWYSTRPIPPRPEYSFRQLTYDSGLTTTPAISRDGKLVIYASDRASGSNLDLFVQQVSGGKPVRLTDHAADDFGPTFSPDSTQIVFQSARDGGGLYILSALGGDARLLAKNGTLPQFSPDGKTIAFQLGEFLRESSVFLVPFGGGPPRKLETDVPHAESPVWSPDGKSILFAGAREGSITNDWFVVAAEGGHATAVGMPDRFFRDAPGQWLADGRVIPRPRRFASQRAQLISLGKDHRFLSAESIAAGVGAIQGLSSDPQADLFVTAEVQTNMQIWSVPIDGNSGRVKGPIAAETQGPGQQGYPTVSADGRMLAYNSRKSGISDVYLRDLKSGVERALTSSPIGTGRGELSPDGGKVAYGRDGSGRLGSLFTMSTKGGVEEKVCDACVGTVLGWTPDSRQIVTGFGRPVALILIDTQTGKQTPLLRQPSFDLHRGQFSPDGSWLAFNPKSANGTQSSIRITPFLDGAAVQEDAAAQEKKWISITDGSGDDGGPTWSPDGNLLYFYTGRAGFQDMWAQKLDPATKRPAGAPFEVLAFHAARRRLNSSFGKAVTRDKFFWAMEEITGNIWVAERRVTNP